MFFVLFFHDYGFTNHCLSSQCKPIHPVSEYDRKSDIKSKFLFCLPVIGQIAGIIGIHQARKMLLKDDDYIEKVINSSLIIRGCLTFLGLGVLCLLIDIIVTLAAIIKNRCYKKSIDEVN